MKVTFADVDRETLFLLPPSVQDWLPEGHLARFVVDIVEQLDLRSLKASYSGRGSQPYNPEMLVALLFYGYATGVFSSRKLERSTYDSVAFRFIAANSHPDHDTIASFRRRFLPDLKGLFVKILMIAHEMDVLKLGTVSLDGTKVKANASKHKALSYEHANKLEAQLKAEVAELLKKADAADKADIPDGMSIPEELERRTKRLAAIAAAKNEIERRAAERAKKERETGKKPGGKKPKPPTAGPTAKDQVNLNDSESRIMPTSGGGFEQAYNAQAGVDTKTMLIVAKHVTQHTNDKQEVTTALENITALPEALGSVTEFIADCGYFSETNVAACEQEQITPYIAVDRQSHNQPLWDRFREPPPLPDDVDAVTRMKHRLTTVVGKEVYAARKRTIEPVFGIIKSVLGFRSFLLRGYEAVQGEWDLVCIAWNIKRLHVLAK
ncbi:MAG: IS1182 family transposase [Desulfuromonadales bacterium]|nr:IS1182 family transposase [Desulfuromonadales bacterium]